MSGMPSEAPLRDLTDREILIMVYSKVDDVARRTSDHETRIRTLEAQTNRTLGIQAATGGGSGAIAGTVVAIMLRLLGGGG